jgi:NTE family protein
MHAGILSRNMVAEMGRRSIAGLLSLAASWLAVAPMMGAAQVRAEAGAIVAPPPSARPRIGLVLSGGGARGAAHVGVLKALEAARVPIDAIAGTSMGAVVGGLYASGMSAADMEATMTTVDWQDAFRDRPPRRSLVLRRKREDQNFLVRFPLGISGGAFKLPKGLIQGQKLTQILRRLTMPVAAMREFDRLPTPFRAVATDLETGALRVLDRGDLTDAMRASLAAPGLFNPVEIDGQLLVDGGLAANLPIEVARAMQVDVLIVVDVGFPLQTRAELNSVARISNQMLAILIQRESERQRRELRDSDVLIAPALGSASSFDFTSVRRAIEIGIAGAEGAAPRLAALAMDATAYEQWRVARAAQRGGQPHVDFVRVDADSGRYGRALQGLFADLAGDPAAAARLDARVTSFYGRGDLESLDYNWLTDSAPDGTSRQGLVLRARRNAYGPNYVRFGLNLQDDFEGNSSFNAAARFVMTELTERGAELSADFQIGESPVIGGELYWPLDDRQRWFVAPQARLTIRNVPVSSEQRLLAEYRVRSFDAGLDFGREFGNWGELRVGAHIDSGRSRVRIGDPALPSGEFDVRRWFARFSYDALDDVNFPRNGQSFSAEWRSDDSRLRDGFSGEQAIVDGLIARSAGRNTGVLWLSGGSNFGDDNTDPRTLFSLGGFLNLSGLRPDSITGRHFALARLLYYRKVGKGGEGFLNVPTYLGVSFEAGNVWDRRGAISFGGARRNGSIFVGLDTLLGPVYLGAGFNDNSQNAYYLFLGRTF